MSPIAASVHISSTAILPVADMVEAVAFYRRLGFEVEAFDDGYAWVRHEDHEILHLRLAPDFEPALNESAVYLHVADVAELHAPWAREVATISGLQDRPWGMREFSFTDPNGNLIRVGHNI